MDKPIYFKTPEELRKWFAENHETKTESWIGFYKKDTGIESITWPESVDQALCFGWIDGIRKKVDDKSYKIRFAPRNPKSHWSAINLEKVKQLKKAGLIQSAGLKVYNTRNTQNQKKAYAFFERLARGYRKTTIHWNMSAKQEATLLRRFTILIESCLGGKKVPSLEKTGE